MYDEANSRARIAIVYERVSTDGQDIRRQAAQRERAAAEFSTDLIEVIQDDGVSAFTVPVFVLSYLLVNRAASPGLAITLTVAAWGLFHLLFQRLLHFPFETGLIQEWLAK